MINETVLIALALIGLLGGGHTSSASQGTVPVDRVLAFLREHAHDNDVPEAVTSAASKEQVVTAKEPAHETGPFTVPLYSQFTDISTPKWKKVGCGIASLGMIIDYYKPGPVNIDTLLQQGINAGAYLQSAGWTYAGLIGLSRRYGLSGTTLDYGGSTMERAFSTLETDVAQGPVMASVHYKFEPTNPIPHLVVVRGISDGRVYYNDPAAPAIAGSISVEAFKNAWKKRYIKFWQA